MKNRKEVLSIAFILVVSLLTCLPLIKPGLYTMHDDQQVARLFLYDKALKSGQVPVRIVDELGFGLGYPLFIFYPPGVYMLGEVFHLLGFGFINSVKLVFASSIILSAIAMYLCAKEFYGRFAAVMSSVFYLLVPYRALDVYVRGALAESFAFVWPPLILWSFYKLYKSKEHTHLILSGILLALLAITHNLMLLPFLTILPVYLFYLLFLSSDKKEFMIKIILACMLGAGLSAFFWLPSLAEKRFTLVDQLLLTNLADFRIHFVYPQQLWNWPWGFGGSAPGLADGISFKIGKLHVIASVLAASFAFSFFALSKTKNRLQNKYLGLPLLFGLLLLLSAFMTTGYSNFVWELVKPLDYLQFPWRYLMFTALFASLLAGNLIFQIRVKVLQIIAATVLVSGLLYTNLKLFQPQFFRTGLRDSQATSYEQIAWDVSGTSFEYLPKGTKIHQLKSGGFLPDIAKDQIFSSLVNVIAGTAEVNDIHQNPSGITFVTNSKTASTLQIRKANFPGWIVKIDGKNVLVEDNNPLKMITFSLPIGIHQIGISFTNTKVITFANLISLMSLIILMPVFFYERRH